MELRIKPKFSAFVLYPIAIKSLRAIAIGFLLAVLTFFLLLFFLLPDLVTVLIIYCFIFILFISLLLIDGYIRYKKEIYEVFDGKFIKYSGSIFTSSTTEIELDKIIAYKEHYHFIKSTLFNTKDVFIESRGTQLTTIKIDSVDIHLLESFINDLNARLGLSNVSQKEHLKPSSKGFLILIIRYGQEIGSLVFYTMILEGILLLVGINEVIFLVNILLWFPYSGIYLTRIIYALISNLLDLHFTYYLIFDRAILVKKGILSQSFTLIPNKSITDTKSSQEFLEKIFNTKSIVLSIKSNPSFAVLEYLPNNYEIFISSDNSAPASGTLSDTKTNLVQNLESIQSPGEIMQISDQSFSLVLRPDALRFFIDIFLEAALLAVLILITYLLPQLSVITFTFITYLLYKVASQIREVFFTKYSIDSNVVSRDYNFLTSETSKLSSKNISSVDFSENWIDKILNTCTITFYSLGGSESIRFSNINKTQETLNISKSIISYQEEDSIIINSNLKFSDYLLINPPRAIVSFITIGFLIVIINLFFPKYTFESYLFLIFAIISYLLISLENFFGYKKALMKIGKRFISVEYGWWQRVQKITRIRLIKQVNIKKYPFVNYGEIFLIVAGGSELDLKNIFNPEDALSKINKFLYEKEDLDHVEFVFKPNFMNKLIKFGFFSLLFPPLFITIPYLYLKNYLTTYIVTNNKIISISGVLYRSISEIYFKNIDYYEEKRDFINKSLGNSKLYIYTSGSGEVNIVIQNIEGVDKIIDKIISQSLNAKQKMS